MVYPLHRLTLREKGLHYSTLLLYYALPRYNLAITSVIVSNHCLTHFIFLRYELKDVLSLNFMRP